MNNPHQKALVKLFEECRYRHDLFDLWRDACEMWALAISNRVDLRQYDAREARYMEIISRYDKETQQRFPQMFGELTEALDGTLDDVLGQTFMELELSSKWKGQFFTPTALALVMARVTIQDLDPLIREKRFITVQEPAVGGGVTILALAQAMADAGFNFQRQLHVTAIDIDITCVAMAYIQFSLHYIPAIVIHGDTLKLEERSHWFTPAHILDGWSFKLRGEQHPVDRAREMVDRLLAVPEPETVAVPVSRREAKQLELFEVTA
jgi:type I restriction-modification system DNA methylase subunit